MVPKIYEIVTKLLAFGFAPASKWELVKQFIEMGWRFWHHQTNAGETGTEIIIAFNDAFINGITASCILMIAMHVCHGNEIRSKERVNAIQPMNDESRWPTWFLRIILLTRH